MKFCPTCGIEYAETERFCPQDGTPLRGRDPKNDLVGTVIADRYHVLKKLGEGGMGQVYLAEHLRMKRKSAVKVMHPSMTSDADAIGRFNREASNACQIDHPNVAAIYDFGETTDGLVYLAMEFIDGASLQDILRTEGSLPPARVAQIVRQIADGLHAAHELGIVHRDLKPDNVLIAPTADATDRVKVVDFGISKANEDGQTVTRTGQVVGTPAYMSPEQLTDDTLDRRSDVYTLAIVAFHLLTGRLPFRSESTQAAMLTRLTEPPLTLATVRPDVGWPPELQRVFDRTIVLDIAQRPGTAPAFAAALADALSAGAPMLNDVKTVLADAAPHPSPPITPGALNFPLPSGVMPAELARIEAGLAKNVGPIARVLVRRAAASATSREMLLEALAKDIDDPRERELFRTSLR